MERDRIEAELRHVEATRTSLLERLAAIERRTLEVAVADVETFRRLDDEGRADLYRRHRAHWLRLMLESLRRERAGSRTPHPQSPTPVVSAPAPR
ncbi:MAG: hypothetical protein ACRELV_07505 [Longimicrobiales bacterium]